MPLTIISGGQTGVDQAALRAAKSAGLATGGFAPKGWLTENGSAPWLRGHGLAECEEPGYPARTKANVALLADHVLWIGNPSSPGGRLTLGHARRLGIPATAVDIDRVSPAEASATLLPAGIDRLMVGGNRESSAPGVGVKAEAWLAALFLLMKVPS